MTKDKNQIIKIVFRFEKSFWLISLIREQVEHNVIKVNSSKIQFCIVSYYSDFCEAL